MREYYDFWDTHKLADQLVALAKSPQLLNDMKRGIKSKYACIIVYIIVLNNIKEVYYGKNTCL